MKAAVILLLVVAAAQAQLSSTRDEDCKDNETFQTCGSACEPSCDAPSPGFCTLQCVVGCQCDKGFFRRSDKACVTKDQCTITPNATAPVAPILPAILPAPSNLTCGANEEANECHNPCTEKKCPVKNAPLVNCLMACMNGCSCKKGYLRNKQGQCVKDADCPPVDNTENQCNLVDCRTGHKCVIQNGNPVCIPDYSDTPAPTIHDNNSTDINIQITPCSTVKCAAGTECQEQTRNCTKPPCQLYAFCINVTTLIDDLNSGCATMRCGAGQICQEAMVMKCGNSSCPRHGMCVDVLSQNDTLSSCASVTCPIGATCQETEVQCFVAPCPKQVSCVQIPQHPSPMPPPATSGCATMRCGAGQVCQEAMVKCAKAPCPSHGMCVDDVSQNATLSSCASVTCPVGESCEETEVQCFVAPCPKAVSCVPINANQNSTAQHGCDVVKCRANEVCEEQVVQCLKALCPIQVACVSIIHTNGTAPTTNATVTGSPGSVCPKNQTMSNCLNTCSEDKCPGGETSMMCTKHCGQGCACLPGFVRSSDGECYKSKDCPPEQMCGQNEEYRCEKCAGTCKNPEPNCPGPKSKNCNKKCICAAGFVKKNGKCVTLASCPDHDHSNITCLGTQDFTDCLPKCRQLCSGVTECDTNMHTEMCTPGCVCRPNYKLDSNGDCVHNRHCFKTTDCPDNEEWSKCVSDDNICNIATIQKVPLRDRCFSGCICATGFARNSNGTCVEQDKC